MSDLFNNCNGERCRRRVNRLNGANAPVAQLDRALPSEGKGHTFESCRVRHICRHLPRSGSLGQCAGYHMATTSNMLSRYLERTPRQKSDRSSPCEWLDGRPGVYRTGPHYPQPLLSRDPLAHTGPKKILALKNFRPRESVVNVQIVSGTLRTNAIIYSSNKFSFNRFRMGAAIMTASLVRVAMGVVPILFACGCASVHQDDLDTWRGRPVSDLEKHPIFATFAVVRTVASDGTEIRDYVNAKNVAECSSEGSIFKGAVNMASYNSFMSCTQNIQACHAVFTIKNGTVESLSAIGTGGARCYSNESMRPGFSGSVNVR